MSDCSTHAFDVPLKPCPFCSAEPEVLSDGHRTWGLVQHNKGCLFPVYPKHEISESDFAAWNMRHQCGLTDEDYSILLDELGVSERTCRIEGRYGNQYCTCCGEMVGTWDSTSELCVSGNMVELWNYCPNCGARVVE
ncbi:MAG: hypothetical protein IKF14_05170 [Atopobiaceae bacterium]|nr:hypothetical protein [Atopobiaceae bacterium]MBR3158480.1 hypothetical protein [Atopobiaceae bacterium]